MDSSDGSPQQIARQEAQRAVPAFRGNPFGEMGDGRSQAT